MDGENFGGGRQKNVLGGALIPCSVSPMTGFFRDGCCHTSPDWCDSSHRGKSLSSVKQSRVLARRQAHFSGVHRQNFHHPCILPLVYLAQMFKPSLFRNLTQKNV